LDDNLIIGKLNLFKEVSNIIKRRDQNFANETFWHEVERTISESNPMVAVRNTLQQL